MKHEVIAPCRRAPAVLLVALLFVLPGYANPAAGKALTWLDDAITAAAKVSGRELDDAARAVCRRQLEAAVARHGDEAVLAVQKGGIELLELSGRHSDDVIALAIRQPGAVRALALHGDELLPLLRRTGSEVLALEAKKPGLCLLAAKQFDDDAVRYLAQKVPPDDVFTLASLAGKADTPETKRLLVDTYRQHGRAFLGKLDWKVVMASGLSAATIVAAYKVSDGAQEGLKKHPEIVRDAVRFLLWPIPVILLLVGAYGLWLWHRRHGRAQARTDLPGSVPHAPEDGKNPH